MFDLIGPFLSKGLGANPDELPAATVGDCLIRLLAAAVREYLDGTTPIALELTQLVDRVLSDEAKADPLLRSLGILERQTLLLTLSQLRTAKEKAHVRPQDP
jgi:hypothetical protein